jgi:hypothetical protein
VANLFFFKIFLNERAGLSDTDNGVWSGYELVEVDELI